MLPKKPFELPKPIPATPTRENAATDEKPATPIRWRWVIRDVMVLVAATFWGSRLIGFNIRNANNERLMHMQQLMYVLSMTIGFLMVAYMVRRQRVRHFALVALFLWLGSFSFGIFKAPLSDLLIMWLASAPQIIFAALVGGGIGSLLFRSPKK